MAHNQFGIRRGYQLATSFLLIVLALSAFASPVAAKSRQVASGYAVDTGDTQTFLGMVGNDSLYFDITPGTFYGGITGKFVDQFYTRVRPDGSFTGYGTEVCTDCSIGGKTGTFYARFTFAGNSAGFSGKQFFTKGTGGLKGLHGGGTFQTGAVGNDYVFSFSFERE